MKKQHHVVIIGGGFGGLWAAKTFKNSSVKITLIDKRNFHLFQPLLYQVATGSISPGDIASPLRGILSRQKNLKVMMGQMIDIDYQHQQVILNDGRIDYDFLIVATGAVNHYYGNEQWGKYAPGLKSIEDAIAIRRKIYSAFEMAEIINDPVKREELLTFIIIGGGPTGVELAGAIGEIAHITLKNDFQNIDPSYSKILLLEGGKRILPTFPESLAIAAEKSLNKLGVEVRSGVLVKDIIHNGVLVEEDGKNYRINSTNIMWGAGVKPTQLGEVLVKADGALLDKQGRIKVNNDLSIPGHENVFVIGDLAHFEHNLENPLPGVAPVAMSQGRYAARLIMHLIKGKKYKSYHYINRGNLAVIGRAAAIADFGWLRVKGYPAWLLWLFVHLMYLVEFDNRLIVFVEWAWSYFTRKRGVRLITYDINIRD
ncbi:MAG: NAD(P)/FAD-dependent oxidoreductase [bacterium]